MSAYNYTPQQVRDVIDDVDAILREAITTKTLKKVFGDEKRRLVSFFLNLLTLLNISLRILL